MELKIKTEPRKFLLILPIIIMALLLLPQVSHGAITLFGETINCDPGSVPSGNGCGVLDFVQAVKIFVGFLVKIAIPLAAVFILWGGIVIITASGSTEKVAQGKKIITAAAIGLAIIMSAWLILFTIFKILESVSGPLLTNIRQKLFNR